MPGTSLSEWSNRVWLLESQDKLSRWVRFSPFYHFVQAVFPVAIIIGAGGLVEIEVDEVVVGDSLFSYELIQRFQALYLNMFEVALRGNPWRELFQRLSRLQWNIWPDLWILNVFFSLSQVATPPYIASCVTEMSTSYLLELILVNNLQNCRQKWSS